VKINKKQIQKEKNMVKYECNQLKNQKNMYTKLRVH